MKIGKNVINEKALINLKKEKLIKLCRKYNLCLSENLQSIVLQGGKGTRLNDERKLITAESFPKLNKIYWGQIGPKGLANLTCTMNGKIISKPLIDWHLDIHAFCPEINDIKISIGHKSEIILEYMNKMYGKRYRNIPISFLLETRPAGTIAPIVKLYIDNSLSTQSLVYANGDNLIDLDLYKAYLAGCLTGYRTGIPLDNLVIVIAALVPWEESGLYGSLDLDFETGIVSQFKEKAPKQYNSYIDLNGKRMTPINSGISIIVNPRKLYKSYLTEEIITASIKLEKGELDYKENEKIVKYETLYDRIARDGKMVSIYSDVYWIDLGTENKIVNAENNLPCLEFIKSCYT